MIHHLYSIVHATASRLKSLANRSSRRCRRSLGSFSARLGATTCSHADRIRSSALHPRLVALMNVVCLKVFFPLEQLSYIALFLELDALGLLGQYSSVIAVQVGEQAAPIVPKIVWDCLIVLLKLLV